MKQAQYDLIISEYWKHPVTSIDDLNDKILVSCFYTKEDEDRFKEYVLKFYFDIWKKHKRAPEIMEVVDKVYEYNYEIFTQMALINISENNDLASLSEDDYEFMLAEETDSIAEMYSQYDCAGIDYAVAEVLNDFKLTFTSNGDDILFDYVVEIEYMMSKMDVLNKSSEIIVNDCQTIMFEDMLDSNFTTSAGSLLYFNDNRNALTIV